MTRTGADIFAAYMPPGSTRSAPTRRPCPLLKEDEECKSQSFYFDVLEFMFMNSKEKLLMKIENAFK